MKKALIVVVALAIVFAIPDLRNRVGTAALPLLERLGPVGQRMADPFREVSARNEIKFFIRILTDDYADSRPIPDDQTFLQWIDRRMPQETGIDPWDNPYWMRRRDRSIIIGSSGADGVRGTDDDVFERLNL